MSKQTMTTAAEDLKRLGKSMKGIIALAELLDKGASLENRIEESEAKLAKVREDIAGAEQELKDARETVEAAYEEKARVVQQATDQAKEIVDQAKYEAQSIKDGARTRGDEMIAEATEKVRVKHDALGELSEAYDKGQKELEKLYDSVAAEKMELARVQGLIIELKAKLG